MRFVPRRPLAPSASHPAERLKALQALLVSCAILSGLPVAAHAGSYTMTSQTGGTATIEPGYSQPYSGNPYGGDGGSKSDGPASCTGTITTLYTWTPANGQTLQTDPPPQQVIVTQFCDASWHDNEIGFTGQCDNGLGGTEVDGVGHGDCSGTLYAVKSGGASVTITCSPSASSDGDTPACDWDCAVRYTAGVSPVTIQITGTKDPIHGDYRVLTGQKITASVQGINGYTVNSYHWQGIGSGFKNYAETAASNQLVPLAGTDLAGSGTVPDLNFYDAKQEDLTITCTVTLTAPDGTSLSVTATSPTVSVKKPTVSWPITTGTVQYSSSQQAYGLYGNPNGVTWSNVVVTVPTPFSAGGLCTFTQIVTPHVFTYDASNTSHDYGTHNGEAGVDGAFDYGNEWSPAPSQPGGDIDSPAVGINGLPVGTVKVTASEEFTTWVMYKPTGGVWVPLSSYNWSWSEQFNYANSSWSLTQASPTSSPTYTATPTTIPPQWTLVH